MPITASSTTLTFNDSTTQTFGALAKAWVNFNGTGVVAIRASFGMSSITDNGTGDYSYNLSPALADANFAFVQCTGGSSSAYLGRTIEDLPASRTSSFVRVQCLTPAAVTVDPAQVSGAFYR